MGVPSTIGTPRYHIHLLESEGNAGFNFLKSGLVDVAACAEHYGT